MAEAPATSPRQSAGDVAATEQTPPSSQKKRANRRSREKYSRRLPLVTISGTALCVWLLLFIPLHANLDTVPLYVLTIYDIVLACLGVFARASSSAKTGVLPFWHACSRLKHSNARGFLSWLHLVQAIHLHTCARLEMTWPRMASALLTTIPWWMDRRGGWTIVLRGASSFGDIVDEGSSAKSSTLSLLLSHVLHLHGLFHGLNLTCALSHFAEDPDNNTVVQLPHFRLYFVFLNLTCAADVLLQPLADRRLMTPKTLSFVLGVSVVPACVFALPVLAEHVSVQGAFMSFALWWGREHRAFSNLLLAMTFTEVFEVASLLAARYSIVDE